MSEKPIERLGDDLISLRGPLRIKLSWVVLKEQAEAKAAAAKEAEQVEDSAKN